MQRRLTEKDSVTEKIHLFNNKAAICFIAPRVVCFMWGNFVKKSCRILCLKNYCQLAFSEEDLLIYIADYMKYQVNARQTVYSIIREKNLKFNFQLKKNFYKIMIFVFRCKFDEKIRQNFKVKTSLRKRINVIH